MKINTNPNAKKSTPWFDVKCREDIHQGALFRLAKRLTEGEAIEKEFDSFLGVDRYRFAIVTTRDELSAVKKYPDCIGNTKCFCSEFIMSETVCDYSAGEDNKKCTHRVRVENAALRADLSAVKQERDCMRNCHNCLHTQNSGGTCAAWSHGECSDYYEDGETKLKHWQPREGQP